MNDLTIQPQPGGTDEIVPTDVTLH